MKYPFCPHAVRLHEPTWNDGARLVEIWSSTLASCTMPRLDVLRMSDIVAVLLSISTVKYKTARPVRNQIGTTLKWSAALGVPQRTSA